MFKIDRFRKRCHERAASARAAAALDGSFRLKRTAREMYSQATVGATRLRSCWLWLQIAYQAEAAEFVHFCREPLEREKSYVIPIAWADSARTFHLSSFPPNDFRRKTAIPRNLASLLLRGGGLFLRGYKKNTQTQPRGARAPYAFSCVFHARARVCVCVCVC